MARRSFRDRFWSPPVARAVTSPGSIVLAGAAAAVGIVVTAPLALPLSVLAGVAAGGVAYGARVLAAVPRDRDRSGRIDPFQVQEPWRRFVIDALDSRRRFDDALRTMDAGPLRDRLTSIGERLDDGVEEIWRVCQRGHTLVGARQRLDVRRARRELEEIEARPAAERAPGSRLAQTADAVRAQIASAERMDGVIVDAESRVRLLDARLDEAVTRAIELSSGSGSSALAGDVGGDVDGIVTEMEALRLALDDVGRAGGAGGGGTGDDGPLPGTGARPSPS